MFTRRGSWDCFDTPSHIPYVFVVRVMNEIHIVHIAYRQRLMYMRVKQSKFTKIKTKNIFKQGVRARCAGPGSAFGAKYMHACIWKIEVPLKKSQEIVIFTSMNIFNWYISTRPLHVNFGYICLRVIKYCVLYLYQLQVLQLNYKSICSSRNESKTQPNTECDSVFYIHSSMKKMIYTFHPIF